MKENKIPAATILRLSIYYRFLQELLQDNIGVVSSAQLAKHTNVNPAQLRKDLSYFGRFGVRGVGYDVAGLAEQISMILGLEKTWKIALIGVGNIGTALLKHKRFNEHGYNIVAAFDANPDLAGTKTSTDITIQPISELADTIKAQDIDIAIIAVPPESAQQVADEVVKAGIKGILNFAPVRLKVPSDVSIQHVDFTILLDTLSYSLAQNVNTREKHVQKDKPFKNVQGWSRAHSWPVANANFVVSASQ